MRGLRGVVPTGLLAQPLCEFGKHEMVCPLLPLSLEQAGRELQESGWSVERTAWGVLGWGRSSCLHLCLASL